MTKLLIANRSEIALRIIRTCHKLGIQTVVVYSDPDRESMPLWYADEKYALGGAAPNESYLNGSKLIRAALDTGCDAIHPGYGFLSEDAGFVKACEQNDLVFIGPSSSSLEKLANKLLARKTMKEAGIPLIPGSDDPLKDEDEAVNVSRKIGYPVIIKAVYGGGGRGMRIAQSDDDVRRYFSVTRMESRSAFGRAEIYVEKRLEHPRHVEIQAIADKNGKILSLGERECSIQRRHQKLLEEAPSVAVNHSLRGKLDDAAKKGLLAAGYTNAGTVEFLLDASGKFYFLEVNKRLQVEHLVTELTTGIDIVEAQLSVALNSRLEFSQNEVDVSGWAINCRINAEDTQRDFAPSPGTVVRYHPPSGPGVRVDSALYSGHMIPEYYDSMVAKIASCGRNREEAIRRMKCALDETEIIGVPTTMPLHRALMEDPSFLNGSFHTTYLDEFLPRLRARLLVLEKFAAAAACATTLLRPTAWKPNLTSSEQSRWRAHARTQFMNSGERSGW